MKRWLWILVIVALIAVGWYYFIDQGHLKRSRAETTVATEEANSDQNALHSTQLTWETVERPQYGIKLEMPAGAKDAQAPAFNSNGSSEQVDLLSSNPTADVTYAFGWENDPPVARANRHDPARTLEAARDGMLQRTQTSLIQQSSLVVGGFPAIELSARNSGGGILDARLIYANGRMYSLIVTLPGLAARRQMDVDRFFNSFTPSPAGQPSQARS